MGLYDYDKVLEGFNKILSENCERANLKKEEYLDKIVMIFKQFLQKCKKEIDHIIQMKIEKLSKNYELVHNYIEKHEELEKEQKNLIVAQFLIKPFERFPFSGNKNQKLFKQQYNLIQKASVLIQQTLIESFNEDQVPTFENQKFFHTLNQHGIGKQSLTKLRLNPQNFSINLLHQITPLQNNISSLKLLTKECMILVGDSNFIEIWDIEQNYFMKKLYIENHAAITSMLVFDHRGIDFLVLGFSDVNPCIQAYRLDNMKIFNQNITHTRTISKLVQYNEFLISGSVDGVVCIHSFNPIKTLCNYQHLSGIQDIIIKNTYVYLLQKSSTVCEYEIQMNVNGPSMHFRRSLSAGYISMIRYPQVTTNFSGIGCHIYGLSQIQITRKFKIEQTNIINVPEMISDFIVLESKQTSQFFALCIFQNSSAIRIYSLISQEQVYEFSLQDFTEVGVAGYLPKIQITHFRDKYILAVISQTEFDEEGNKVKVFQIKL